MITNLVSLCSARYLPIFKETLPKWISLGLIPTVYCTDYNSINEIGNLGANVIDITSSTIKEGNCYGTVEFLSFVSIKFDVILKELKDNDVFFVDGDVLPLINPMSFSTIDCDIYAQNDISNNIVDREFQICTGCWWLRSCSEVIQLIIDAKKLMSEPRDPRYYYCDETVINILVNKNDQYNLKIKYAPLDKWINGSRLEEGVRVRDSELVHFNGKGRCSVEEKVSAIREYTKNTDKSTY